MSEPAAPARERKSVGLLRGVGKSLRWLVATGWGLAVLFGLCYFDLGTLLRHVRAEVRRNAAAPQHPAVVALVTPAGIEVVPFSSLTEGPDDSRIAAFINLAGEWHPHRRDRTTIVAWRRTFIQVDAVRELTAGQTESARDQFLSLQRAWGNAAFVRGLNAGPASVASRPVVHWDILRANFRSFLIPLLLTISVAINVIRSLRWIYQQLSRDVERERLASGLCPNCRYDTTALPILICPECGTDLEEARRQIADRAAGA